MFDYPKEPFTYLSITMKKVALNSVFVYIVKCLLNILSDPLCLTYFSQSYFLGCW
jgi:hypothetical protein